MSVVLITGERHLCESICETYLERFEAQYVSSLRKAALSHRLAGCILLCRDSLRRRDIEDLQFLREQYPLRRLFVVARLNRQNVELLAKAHEFMERVVWSADLPDRLETEVREKLLGTFLDRGSEIVSELSNLPPFVRAFVEHCWSSPRPFTTVKRVRRAIGVRRSTLASHWSTTIPRARRKDVVDWALIGRSLLAVEAGASWDTAAYRLKIHRRTLARIAERLLKVELEILEIRGSQWLEDRFAAWLETEIIAPARISAEK